MVVFLRRVPYPLRTKVLLSLVPLDKNDDCLLLRVWNIQQKNPCLLIQSQFEKVVSTHTLRLALKPCIIGVDIQLYSL